MAVTPGRLQDPTKRSFFDTDESALESRGGTAQEAAALPGSPGQTGEVARKARLGWSRALLGLWAIIMFSTLFEPAPNPHATVPLWAGILGFGFYTGLFTTVWGLAGNHTWGLKASLATATLGLGMAVACGVTDHHPAFWWGYEVVAMSALLAFNRLALKKTSQ
ncbi:MAG: hypothetical protein QOG21_1410 [Actinomycetota bacterium]|jgi:hypothetical protein|nr:hypothetical protein [Actinomycetota bacterium]